MIEQVDKSLSEWIGSVLTGGVEVSLQPPAAAGTKKIVGLYLKDLLPFAHLRNSRRPPLQVMLRYLVTVQAKNQSTAHNLLGQLLFAAMENSEFEVDLEPVPAEIWTAFGTVPMPSFMLRVPLRLERPDEHVRLIRSPMELHQSPLTGLEGTVMGPGDIPLTNARVELSTHNLVTRTDIKGRFIFPAVPTEPDRKNVRILARGRELSTQIDAAKIKQEPLIINFDVLEV